MICHAGKLYTRIFNVGNAHCIWQKIHSTLRSQLREIEGPDVEPSAGIIDSQSVKTTEKGGIDGYDAGKKINGRKRHILVDTMGLMRDGCCTCCFCSRP